MVGAFGSAAITVVGFRVIGELVGASIFGKVVLVYGVILLIASLCAAPVAQALGKYYFDTSDEVERDRWLLSGILLAGGLAVGGAAIVLTLFYVGLVPIDVTPAVLVASIAIEVVRTITVVWLHSQARFAVVALAQLTDAVMRPIGVVLLDSALSLSVGMVLLAYVIAGLLSVGLLLGSVIARLRWGLPTRAMMRRILAFGMPLIGNSVFGWISSSGDRYIVAAALDVRAAGVYVAASALGGRLSLLLGSSFEAYYRPALYEAVSKSARELITKTCQAWAIGIAISGAAVLGALLLGMQPIQRYLLAPEFREGSAIVVIASFIAYLIVAFGFIPQRINYAYEKTGYVAMTEIAGTVVMAASVFTLGARYGLAGAASGMVVASVARLVLASWLASRTLHAAAERPK